MHEGLAPDGAKPIPAIGEDDRGWPTLPSLLDQPVRLQPQSEHSAKVWSGACYVPVFDDRDDHDLAARDAYLKALPANLRPDNWPIKLVRIARALARHPGQAVVLTRWAARFVGRIVVGLGRRSRTCEGPAVLATIYVMHRFMDAGDVRRAWELMERGIDADEPDVAATQQRLLACAYGMGHPATDRVVPACVQHSVLDPAENRRLIQLLPPRRRT